MIIHGIWRDKTPHRPIIHATLAHESISHTRSIDFIIDTGADKTFIAPDHQEILGISTKQLKFETKPVQTLSGVFRFHFLTGCSLVFNGKDDQPHLLKDITAYFSTRKQSVWDRLFRRKNENRRGQALFGKGNYPSILGRDVLQKLSLGFCRTSDILFISNKHENYSKALGSEFASPRQKPPRWIDDAGDFDIGGFEIENH